MWTRYDGARPLALSVWEGDAERPLPDFNDREVVVEPGGFVHVDVEGLTPGAVYRYAFREKGEAGMASREGRFRTALAPGSLARVSLGATSCTRNGMPMEVMRRAGMQGVDAFLLLGDTIYADGDPPAARTVAQYRDKWTENLSTEGYRALRASAGLVAIWDDHEFANNWAGETIDPELRANGAQAFFEHTPLRRPQDAPDRIWRSLRWGATVELFALDCRGERKPSTRLTPDAEYISKAQLAWLKQALADSPARFKVILNSVPIGQYADLFQLQVDDRWEGYPAQRAEILQYVEDQHIPGVIWLSGDFHMAAAGRAAASGPGTGALEILAGPGAQNANPVAGKIHAPQLDFTSPANNFAVLDLDPERGEVRVSFYDEDGDVFFARTYAP